VNKSSVHFRAISARSRRKSSSARAPGSVHCRFLASCRGVLKVGMRTWPNGPAFHCAGASGFWPRLLRSRTHAFWPRSESQISHRYVVVHTQRSERGTGDAMTVDKQTNIRIPTGAEFVTSTKSWSHRDRTFGSGDPVAFYGPFVRCGDLVFLSGIWRKKIQRYGLARLGSGMTTAQVRKLARYRGRPAWHYCIRQLAISTRSRGSIKLRAWSIRPRVHRTATSSNGASALPTGDCMHRSAFGSRNFRWVLRGDRVDRRDQTA